MDKLTTVKGISKEIVIKEGVQGIEDSRIQVKGIINTL